MGYRWRPRDIDNFVSLGIDELQKAYPELDRKYLRSIKRYYTKRGEADMPERQQPEREILKQHGLDASEGAQIGYHVGFIKNAQGEIEYTRPLPNVRSGKVPHRLEDFISQAAPIRITPNRRKPEQRDYRLIFAFGDAQIEYRYNNGEYTPIHDERVLRVARLICREYQPETIVNLGDTVDLAALSRFPADSDHFRHSLNPAFSRTHQMYAELRADTPHAEIVEVDSNHNTRLAKFILKQAPELYGMRQAGTGEDSYPVLTYPFFANLDAVGVRWISGYGAAEYVYGEEYNAPPIVFRHGNTVVSNGSTAAKESKENPETHVVRGHGHRFERHWRTTRAGRYLASIMVGCSCRIDGHVPSYKSAVNDRGNVVTTQENWQQGFLMITDFLNGHYQFDEIPVHEGVAYYEGRSFDGNDED